LHIFSSISQTPKADEILFGVREQHGVSRQNAFGAVDANETHTKSWLNHDLNLYYLEGT
jgi:hypothetical protein